MGLREKIERIMVAITFAEAGEHDKAREILEKEQRKEPRKRVSTSRQQLRAPSIYRDGRVRFTGRGLKED